MGAIKIKTVKIELKVIFIGRVQGVFFRASVQKVAKSLCLSGFAKNLPDGTVEVRAIGEKHVLNEFVQQIIKNPGRAQIEHFEISYSDTTENYVGFSII